VSEGWWTQLESNLQPDLYERFGSAEPPCLLEAFLRRQFSIFCVRSRDRFLDAAKNELAAFEKKRSAVG
jgi:hypothetical protein